MNRVLIAAVVALALVCVWLKLQVVARERDVDKHEQAAAAAKIETEKLHAQYKTAQSLADANYGLAVANSRAVSDSLRQQRAAKTYVPAARSSSIPANVACYDTAALDAALQRFDAGISGIIAEGEGYRIADTLALKWAQSLDSNPVVE